MRISFKFVPVLVLTALFFINAPSVHAASLTPTQIQAIIGLLQSFNADPATIANVQASLGGTGSVTTGGNAPSSSSTEACVNLTQTLTQGSSGSEVTKLQTFLGITNPNGYFGPATLQALESWQSAHGIASAGSTGYGVVGPKTRAAMACR